MAKVAPSAIPDFTELLTRPPTVTEEYWRHPLNVHYLGREDMPVTPDVVLRHLGRISTVDRIFHFPVLPLEDTPERLRQQLRVRPDTNPIRLKMIDLNTASLYYSSPSVLQGLPLGTRREAAAFAYHRLGALNYAEDLGHYLMPMLFAIVQKEPLTTEAHGPYGYEQWAADYLVKLGEQAMLDEAKPGGDLYAFMGLLQQPEFQPGRINFSTGLLLEIGEYFAHDQVESVSPVRAGSLERSNQISECALNLARKALREQFLGSYPYGVLGINRFIANQLLKRQHDVEMVDLQRKVKFGEIEEDAAWLRFADIQMDFLDDFEGWCLRNPDQEGLAFEWLTIAILNAGIFLENQVGEIYARASTAREDYPEDYTRGSLSSCKQAHDVVLVVGGMRQPIQCKISSSGVYANPPVHIVKAMMAMGINNAKPRFMERFQDTAKKVRNIYEGCANRDQVDTVIEIRDRILKRVA